MKSVAELVGQLRGEMTCVEMAARTGVSRQTIMAIEAGVPTKVATLRQLAKGCGADDAQRGDLLMAWVAEELGEDDFALLQNRLSPELKGTRTEQKLIRQFMRLDETERVAVAFAVATKPVREMIPTLNRLYQSGVKAIGNHKDCPER